MKPASVLVALLVAACSSAADLSPQLLRLIGPDARRIVCADLEGQANSVLGRYFVSDLASGGAARPIGQVLTIQRESADGPPLTVLIGGEPLEPRAFTALDSGIWLMADPESVRQAKRRWPVEAPLSPIATRVRRLAQAWDSWFLIVKPLATLAAARVVPDASAPLLKYAGPLIDAVEELSGGIRFGAVSELSLEAVFRDPQDASAAATLARWLPGILQLQSSGGVPAVLLGALEDFRVDVYGQRASISLRIRDDEAKSLLEADRK